MSHQVLMLSMLETNSNFALFCEQGTGKTLPTLIDLYQRFKDHEIKNALVVCPKPVIHSWYRDMDLFDDCAREKLKSSTEVINYDLVWRRDKYKEPFDAIVLDESHAIKNRGSKRTKWALSVTHNAKVRRILTGTPIGNGALENIWSQYAFLNPGKGNRGQTISLDYGYWSHFLNHYAYLNRWFQPYKYKNVDELQRIMDSHSLRITKEDALDLPEKLPDDIWEIDMTSEQKRYYKQMAKESTLSDIDVIAENSLSKSLYLREIATGFIKNDDGRVIPLKSNKPKYLAEFLENYDKKLVIFFNFKQSKQEIIKVLERKNKRKTYRVLDGDNPDKSAWREFQTDRDIQIILCQYQSANQGIDLYAADTILYYEPTTSSTVMEQSRDRIHRIGQTQKCSYVLFSTVGTIEPKIYKALQGYADFNEKLFNEYMEEYQRSYGY